MGGGGGGGGGGGAGGGGVGGWRVRAFRFWGSLGGVDGLGICESGSLMF